jgi:hypothetical protein
MRRPDRPYSRLRLAISLLVSVILFALNTAVTVFALLLYAVT